MSTSKRSLDIAHNDKDIARVGRLDIQTPACLALSTQNFHREVMGSAATIDHTNSNS
jgi:hypothetical protein